MTIAPALTTPSDPDEQGPMMRTMHSLLALAACWVLASCATAPKAPDAPPPGTQALQVRTDPPGAICSILQNGVAVASVAATPGTANLPLVFCRFCLSPGPEEVPPFEIVCSKTGYLASRLTFAVQWAHTIAAEQAPPRDGSDAETAGVVAGVFGTVGATALQLSPLGPFIGLGVAIARANDPPRYDYAYRPLPELLLTPATFDSESDCDAHFASLQTRLKATRDAQRSYIDAQCRFWPCKASDPAPCPDPVCERRRTIADEHLKSQLDQIPALRTRVRIAAP